MSQQPEPEYHYDSENPKINVWGYPTMMAIGPKGQVVTRHLTPGQGDIGDTPIRIVSGRAQLDPLYVDAGWVLYEDLCKGRVPGIPADTNAWTRWQSYCQDMARGRIVRPELLKFHSEVYARENGLGSTTVVLSAAEEATRYPGLEDEPTKPDGAVNLPPPKPEAPRPQGSNGNQGKR